MSDVTITVKSTRRLKLPTLPNFIRDVSDQPVPIEDLTQEQLQEIGRAWTEALCRKARDKVSDNTRAINRAVQARTSA